MPAEDWGVQDTGFVRPTMAEIREDRVIAFRALFGANQPTEPGSVNGRIIDYISETMHLTFALAEETYNSRYLSTVGINAIDLLAEEYGFVRPPATSSTVTLTLGGTAGVVIPALSSVRLDDSLEEWTTTSGGVIGGGGTVDVVFTSNNTGPVRADTGGSWTILTAVNGWTSTANSADATLGRNEQTAAELKAEIRRSVRGSLLAAALLRLTDVTSARVFENDTDVPDALWAATHWAEALVVGGDPVDIANCIALHLSPGIGTFGGLSEVETISGFGETINYSVPNDVDIWIEIDITAGEGFAPADPAALETYIEEQVALWGDANHDSGDDVATEEIRSHVLTLVSGKVVLAVRVGLTGSPTNTTIEAIADRDQAAFDTARVLATIL